MQETLRRHLAQELSTAAVHLAQINRKLSEQRTRIMRLQNIGGRTDTAELFLATLLSTLELHQDHHDRLLRALGE